MNIYTVAKASQGLADYLKKNFTEPSVAIGYDSRIKSDVFAKVAAGVFSANRDAMFESKFFSANTGWTNLCRKVYICKLDMQSVLW